MAHALPDNTIFIYHLPHQVRRELCLLLDYEDKWVELGTYMQYDVRTLDQIREEEKKGRIVSPTDELLTMWGQQNHRVLELFMLLSYMRHYQAMRILKLYVDDRHHYLLNKGEGNIDYLINNMVNGALDIGNVNIDKPCVKSTETKCKGLHKSNCKPSDKEINAALDSKELNFDNAAAMITRDDNVSKPINEEHVSKNVKKMSLQSSDVASSSTVPKIAYEVLQNATKNWDSSMILGKGGFGTVYKGLWVNTDVAIKKLEQRGQQNNAAINIQLEQSMRELHYLNRYRHDNVLPLYGYSLDGPHPCLVYQFLSGGNLEQRLHTRNMSIWLNWTQRLSIVIGVARGLQFLHTIGEKPLIHGDIKSANILLDYNNVPKIGDFGLAREGPMPAFDYTEVSRVHGTKPYLPNEFILYKKLSTKVDTYSFGVVLFEVATGLSAYHDKRKDKYLKDLVVNFEGDINEIMDKRAGTDGCFIKLIDIGKICVSARPKDRPEMVNVLLRLEGKEGST